MAFKSDQSGPEQSPGRSEDSKKSSNNPWIEALQTVGLSVVLALGVRTFVAEARYIPSGSMLPTLEINDRLVVEKISYRFHSPHRGDIVVFHPPEAAGAQFTKEAFIKRVIGLPGETVEVKGGKTFVNGTPLTEDYIESPPDYTWGPQMVPEGSYLMLGDNRNNSDDGHVWGFLPSDRIIGRATIRFWPLDRLAYLADPSYQPETVAK